ncbi:MAG TPA: serine/threonine-protein kinase [Planctomycetota bacterium]
MDDAHELDDRLDALVSEYSDLLAAGRAPRKQAFLERVPPAARPGLERCLKMIESGLAQVPVASVALVPGLRLGRYELVRELGRGGMALVWLARDTELRRPVALKILRPGLALEATHVDRFRREALAIAKLRHPSLVQIHDVGSERGLSYLAMEYVEGPSLARVLEALGPAAGRRFTADELARAAGIPALAQAGGTLEQALARLCAQVATALAVAHAQGIVHRDVKPSNVLLRKDGTPVVVDFGLAKSDGDPALSLTGDTLGTPYYMSPEQAFLAGAKVDHRTDVYSLGVCLFEALTGLRPFEGASVLEVFDKIKNALPPAADSIEARLSRDACAVLRRAMARHSAQRYADAAAFAADLSALGVGQPTQARTAEGGRLRRAWTSWRLYASGLPYEYRSHRTWLGLPLVHVLNGPRQPGQPKRVARGWLAMSPEVAQGVLAFGARAYGVVACGGIACGLFSWGGVSLGLLGAFGGMALGGISFGGMSAGYLALGGCAAGYGAIGGFAVGRYAMGGEARGTYALSQERQDFTQTEFFEHVLGFDLPWFRMTGLP